MLRWLVFLVLPAWVMTKAQAPFVTSEDRFMVFSNGRFEKLEPRPPRRVFPMEGQVIYEDHDGRMKVFLSTGRKLYMLQKEGVGEVKATRQQLAWLATDTLKQVKAGRPEIVAIGVTSFSVFEQGIAYQSQDGPHILWRERTTALPLHDMDELLVGGNTMLLTDTMDNLILFHDGVLDLVSNGNDAEPLAAGRNVAAWWEPGKGLVIHHAGRAEQVIQQRPVEIQAGHDLVAFRFDHPGLHAAVNGELRIISDATPSFFQVVDELVIYLLEGRLHIFSEGGTHVVENYVPEWWEVHGDRLVYLDINREMRGVQGDGTRLRLGKEPAVTDPAQFGEMVRYTSPTGNVTVIHGKRTYIF
jgi:hypothetical protein